LEKVLIDIEPIGRNSLLGPGEQTKVIRLEKRRDIQLLDIAAVLLVNYFMEKP
jgi:hypothetical protein